MGRADSPRLRLRLRISRRLLQWGIGSFAAFVAIHAGSALAQTPSDVPPNVQVTRVEEKDSKIQTLRFLEENLDFFRAQLDLLRMTFGEDHFGYGENLDRRSLLLLELLAEGRAQEDSAASMAQQDRARRLMESVAEMTAVEKEMDTMEEMLRQQRERLARLEEDFRGRQETALIVLMSGIPSGGVPEEVLFQEEGGDSYRISLSNIDADALREGGLAQLLHSFVEPRELRYAVSWKGPGGESSPALPVVVVPERDRLNFVELDFAKIDPQGSIPAHVWVR
jgi:hypothetical protein